MMDGKLAVRKMERSRIRGDATSAHSHASPFPGTDDQHAAVRLANREFGVAVAAYRHLSPAKTVGAGMQITSSVGISLENMCSSCDGPGLRK